MPLTQFEADSVRALTQAVAPLLSKLSSAEIRQHLRDAGIIGQDGRFSSADLSSAPEKIIVKGVDLAQATTMNKFASKPGSGRFNLEFVHVRKKFAYASNGHMILRMPIDLPDCSISGFLLNNNQAAYHPHITVRRETFAQGRVGYSGELRTLTGSIVVNDDNVAPPNFQELLDTFHQACGDWVGVPDLKAQGLVDWQHPVPKVIVGGQSVTIHEPYLKLAASLLRKKQAKCAISTPPSVIDHQSQGIFLEAPDMQLLILAMRP